MDCVVGVVFGVFCVKCSESAEGGGVENTLPSRHRKESTTDNSYCGEGLTISRVSLVKLKVSYRMSMLVARSNLSRRSVEMLNCTWSPSSRVTLDLVSFSPNRSSLS